MNLSSSTFCQAILIIMTWCGVTSEYINASEPLVFRVVDEYPWAYRDQGKYTGIPVEIVEEVLIRMGYEMKVQAMPFPTMKKITRTT